MRLGQGCIQFQLRELWQSCNLWRKVRRLLQGKQGSIKSEVYAELRKVLFCLLCFHKSESVNMKSELTLPGRLMVLRKDHKPDNNTLKLLLHSKADKLQKTDTLQGKSF